MILYHWTRVTNLDSILKAGLRPNSLGIIYLTKFPEKWKGLCKDAILLEVNVPKNAKLTAFDEFQDGTEVLCWNTILSDLKVIRNDEGKKD